MFNLGPTEIVVILVVAILIFGPRLPQVAAEFGGWIVKFRRSVNDLRRDSGIDREIMEVRRQVENAVPREVRSFDPARQVRAGVDTLKREVATPVVQELEAARDSALKTDGGALPAEGATLDRREPIAGPDATPLARIPGVSEPANPATPADPDPATAPPPASAPRP